MTDSHLAPFLAHIAHCHSAVLPGARRPLFIAAQQVGWIDPRLFDAMERIGARDGEIFRLPDDHGLEALGENFARQGLYRPHHELFDVFTDEGVVIGQIDRGALPLFGFAATGVHLNGLVQKSDGLYVWLGRRAANKRLDPGKLDHLVAGGVCAGIDAWAALAKEASEEASLPRDLIAQARHVATLRYAMERPEGLRRDTLHCYDLLLPEEFQPEPADGEVEFFTLLPLAEAFRIVRDTTDMKFNVTLVLIDLFIRQGLFSTEDAAILQNAMNRP